VVDSCPVVKSTLLQRTAPTSPRRFAAAGDRISAWRTDCSVARPGRIVASPTPPHCLIKGAGEHVVDLLDRRGGELLVTSSGTVEGVDLAHRQLFSVAM
jgi:hypothetical protein